MEKFQNRYRIAPARASWWNYAYFITICTKNREHFFGKIEKGKMKLSPVGVLADVFWYEIRNHAMYVELAAFVVMPNHVHGILILDKPESIDSVEHVETGFALSLHRFRNQGKNTISSIVGSYKSAITKHCNRLGLPGDDANVFAWQTRFHDQIIRNDAEYQRINDYIESNPKNWEKDKFWVL